MSYIGAQPTTAAFVTDQFSGDGSTTVFTMSVAPANSASVIVAVSGVLQDPSTYAVSGTSLTFSGAPPAGSGNISARYLGIPASGVATTAYRTLTEFTATSGQTTFSVPSYTVGFINVYRNGVMLGTADFTATSGTTVVLAAGATAGDLVATESFYVSGVSNAIPAVAGAVNTSYITDGAVTQAKLGAGVAGNGPTFMAYNGTSNQSISSNTNTKINLPNILFDTDGCVSSSTFTPTVAGYYQLNAEVNTGADAGTLARATLAIKRNGSQYYWGSGPVGGFVGNEVMLSHSTLMYFNGSTDYAEMWLYVTGTNPVVYYSSGNIITYFSGALVRAA